MGRAPNSLSRAMPSERMPVPASNTIISLSARTSTQEVLPPYRMVPGPGTGIDPRTPQNFRRAGGDETVAMDERAESWHVSSAKPRVFDAGNAGSHLINTG